MNKIYKNVKFVFFSNMGVHSIQVRNEGRVFDVWKIDEDITNIMMFYDAIKEDLSDEEHQYMLDVTAYIRGGE